MTGYEWVQTLAAAWIILAALGTVGWSRVAAQFKRTCRPAPEPDAPLAELLPVEPSSWTYIPVDLPSIPLSWAEQEALNAIERREFSGGAAA